jgi:hypothetical protein
MMGRAMGWRNRPVPLLLSLLASVSAGALGACHAPNPRTDPQTEFALDAAATQGEPESAPPLELPPPRPETSSVPPGRLGWTVEIPVRAERTEHGWNEMVRLLADRETIATAFERDEYEPAWGSRAMAVRVEEGFGMPRLHSYSLGGSAFEVTVADFHPASTVKLGATVGALMLAARHGATGDTRTRFEDANRAWNGPLREVYIEALLHSSNMDYNRLMAMAGYDLVNEELLSPRWGLPNMVLQSRYGGTWRSRGFRHSPQVEFIHSADDVDVVPERDAESPAAKCRSNCTSLAELHEIQRRVFLHDELPEAERFPIQPQDLERIRANMLRTRNRLGSAPSGAMGGPVEVYNNVGRIPGIVLVENAYLQRTDDPMRMFVTVSIGFPRRLGDDTANTVRWIGELCGASLRAALEGPLEGPGLQHAWGGPIVLGLSRRPETANALRADLLVPSAGRIRVWLGREEVADLEPSGPWSVVEFPNSLEFPASQVMTVEAWSADGEPLAYRTFLLDLPGFNDAALEPGDKALQLFLLATSETPDSVDGG